NVAAVISRAIDMDLSAVPNVKAWLIRCLERPAARRALALKTRADNETPVEGTRRIAKINRLGVPEQEQHHRRWKVRAKDTGLFHRKNHHHHRSREWHRARNRADLCARARKCGVR